MGQGAYLSITNNTEYDWHRTHQHSYQMDAWNFPIVIKKGTNYKVYIEWDENIFHHKKDDAGEAVYTFQNGQADSFTILARNDNDFDIRIDSTQVHRRVEARRNNLCQLGWIHDGIMNFCVAGNDGKYIVTGDDVSHWMEDTKEVIGEKPLGEICMPGSHDAGMSVCQNGTVGACEHNTKTQVCSIRQQLEYGSRYFDIRPTISGGDLYTGHYCKTELLGIPTDMGSNGQKLSEIIEQVNAFTQEHNEVVILNISHSLNTDVGQGKYRGFNEEEWDRCLSSLAQLNNRYINTDLGQKNIGDFCVNDFLERRANVIVVVEDLKEIPSKFISQGFYTYKQYDVYNKYANTDELETMIGDQLSKMKANNQRIFLLSWTLTQDTGDAINLIGDKSILDLAEKANESLDTRLYPELTASLYPNIIYIDKVNSTQAALLSCAVNFLAH